jgi:hypothetical protein
MASIKVTMKDGKVRDFLHVGRAGGSYTKTLRYEGAFAVIEDEDGKTISIPAADIAEIETTPTRGRW